MANFMWLWGNWRGDLSDPWIDPLLALMAVACGLIVGSERQRREKPAGLRTLTLVCLGSATFTMMSFAFTSTTGDSGRVAAQIVTGIGFLGAGVILHGRRTVTGMTTAAIIWMTAAIGMAVGAGYAIAGIALSFLVDRLLVGIFLYETRWHPDLRHLCVTIDFEKNGGITRVLMERVLVDYSLGTAAAAEWSETPEGNGRLTLHVRLARIHLYELLAVLAEVPHVLSLSQSACPVTSPPHEKT